MSAHHTGPRRSPDEQARMLQDLRISFEKRITFNALLGIHIVSYEPSSPRVRFDMRPDLIGDFVSGRLHGGVTASVLDATGGLALMLSVAEKFCDENSAAIAQRIARIGTIDLRIDYLRQAKGPWFEAQAEVVRLGGRIGSVHMRLRGHEGDLLATGSAAYVVS